MKFSDRPNLVIHGYVPETNAISSFRRLTSLLIQYLSVLRESHLTVALAAPVKAKRASVCKQEREQQILGMNVEQILEQEQGRKTL